MSRYASKSERGKHRLPNDRQQGSDANLDAGGRACGGESPPWGWGRTSRLPAAISASITPPHSC
jgi:hypothetical protein